MVEVGRDRVVDAPRRPGCARSRRPRARRPPRGSRRGCPGRAASGASRCTPSIGSVIRYWCAIGTTGTRRRPAARLGRVHPAGVHHDLGLDRRRGRSTTPRHPAVPTSIPVTRMPVRIVAPASRGALGERERQAGRVEVPVGRENAAPSTPRASISGNALARLRRPRRARGAGRRSSPSRPGGELLEPLGEDASRSVPTSCQPGSTPVSAASAGTARRAVHHHPREARPSSRSWPTSPAEWNVEPHVSSARSRSSTSFHPSSARW